MFINNLLAEHDVCTGCGSCYSICSQKAIEMKYDNNGFLFPKIKESLCIHCGACHKACPLFRKNIVNNENLYTYAAIACNRQVTRQSSSGGVFALLAKEVLNMEGTVYGCALTDNMKAVHIRIEDYNMLYRLQGSKYIQSELGDIYKQVKKDLNDNRQVLFSGTPCQVNGLNAFLNKEYPNLFTVDLVCHGVSSYLFFRQYIEWFQKKKNSIVKQYCFRDKTKTKLSCVSRIDYTNQKGKNISKLTKYHSDYYFYYYYMQGTIYRESCYKCPCLPNGRTSDITLGDYWGVESIHKDIGLEDGVSAVIIHTEKGKVFFDKIKALKVESSFENVMSNNKSIIEPVCMPNERSKIFELSTHKGAEAVYKNCKDEIGKKQILYDIKAFIPIDLKRWVRSLLSR